MEITFKPTRRGYCKPSTGAKYADQKSVKTFRSWFRKGLRHVRLPNGRILTKYDWIDQFLEQYEVRNEVKQLAEELTEGL